MKASAVALLGLCFFLALISSTQAGGGKGKGKRGKCEGMKKMDETSKAMWKECGGGDMKKPDGGAEATDGDEGGEGKKKHGEKFKKIGMCMMKRMEIITADNKVNVDKYTESMNNMFESSESANKASEAFKKCCEGMTDRALSEEEMGKVAKCGMKSKRAGCKKKEKKEDES